MEFLKTSVSINGSPIWVVLSVLLAALISWFLYKGNHPWPASWNLVLTIIRGIGLFILFFLLLEPVVRYIRSVIDKPLYVIVADDSQSMMLAGDSTIANVYSEVFKATSILESRGFQVEKLDLEGKPVQSVTFQRPESDLAHVFDQVRSVYEGRKIAGLLMITDGIYTRGLSPLYKQMVYPVSTFGLGDSIPRNDVIIQSVISNKVAYQGNDLPLRVELLFSNFPNEKVKLQIKHKGALIAVREVQSSTGLITEDFKIPAKESGLQRYDVSIVAPPGDQNQKNNSKSVYVEVVKGRKKILMVASSPHPDLKAIRQVLERNANYELFLHVPGVNELSPDQLVPTRYDLIIAHQIPDLKGKTKNLFDKLYRSGKSLLLIYGRQSDFRMLAGYSLPDKQEARIFEADESGGRINPEFKPFSIDPVTVSRISEFPPLAVSFGKSFATPGSEVLMYQRIGSVETQRPLIAIQNEGTFKRGVIAGEGIWQWRMNEFANHEETPAFNEIIGKLIQNLTTLEDRRRFNVFPIRQEFQEGEIVVFEAQTFNENYEQLFGNQIELKVKDEKNATRTHSFVPGKDNATYKLGTLPEGLYSYSATTSLAGMERVSGEFIVRQQDAESQNLTSNPGLLRKLAAQNNGNYYDRNDLTRLQADWQKLEASGKLYTEERFELLLNLWLLFLALILIFGSEWVLRRYWGSY